MPLRYRSIATEAATIALLALVRLNVKLILIAVGQLLAATLADERLIRCVHVSHVGAQVSLTATRGRTQGALEDWLVHHAVNKFVRLKGVGLRKTGLAYVALILLFACVYDQVTLQLKHVLRSVRTVRTLVRTLACMASHMAAQLCQLNAGIAALRTLVRLLLGVLVTCMSYELSAGREGALAQLALVRLVSHVCVQVIDQTHVGLESTLTDRTLE